MKKKSARDDSAKVKAHKNKRRATDDKARTILITPEVLRRRLPLPQLDEGDDKEDRGRVLVVGGAAEMPGAVILTATAALRVGAGKLQIATARSIAPLVAAFVPEARVFALPETKAGAIALSAAEKIIEQAEQVQSIVIGPGLIDEDAVTRLMKKIVPHLTTPILILDAAALMWLAEDQKLLHALHQRVVLTPHAGEMAHLTGLEKNLINDDPLTTARETAKEFRAVVALKGRETFIAPPVAGDVYYNRAGNVGLATSGSGDTLSGLIAGLAARGASPLLATVWGVYLHARAGDRLARRMGRLGFLARELLAEIPPLMRELEGKQKER